MHTERRVIPRAIRVATLVTILAGAPGAFSQWERQESGSRARLRGVSAASADVAWASGADGTVLRTTDGGKTWQAIRIPGAEGLDFRDVHAFDGSSAFLLSIGPGEKSRILKTTDGGKTWTVSYRATDPGVFLDAIAFWTPDRAIALGDPVQGRFDVLVTEDGGRTWSRTPREGMPMAITGEGAFAASGTCLVTRPGGLAWFCTGGGRTARVFRSSDFGRTWAASETPLVAGVASAGAFSLVFRDDRHGVVVGGDYRAVDKGGRVVAITEDGGTTWRMPAGAAHRAFRSAVASLIADGSPAAMAVGPAGADFSPDGGSTWLPLGDLGFHALSFAPGSGGGPSTGFAVGEDGLIARIRISNPLR